MQEIIISPIRYTYENEYGRYKVIKFNESNKKYTVKFEKSNNIVIANKQSIKNNKVIDLEAKKQATIKRNKTKKKTAKQDKREFKTCVYVKGSYTLLSLDCSTRCTGWSIFKDGKLIKYGYIHQAGNNVTKRINGMKTGILDLIDEYNINCMCVEDTIDLHKNALKQLSKLQGVLLDWCYENDMQIGIVAVNSWKAGFDINRISNWKGKNSREVSKEKTVDCVKLDYGIDLKKDYNFKLDGMREPVYYDLADSIGLATYFINNCIKEV